MFHKKLTIVCAWCGVTVRSGGRAVSHGMCIACAAKFAQEANFRQIRPEPATKVDPKPAKTA